MLVRHARAVACAARDGISTPPYAEFAAVQPWVVFDGGGGRSSDRAPAGSGREAPEPDQAAGAGGTLTRKQPKAAKARALGWGPSAKYKCALSSPCREESIPRLPRPCSPKR